MTDRYAGMPQRYCLRCELPIEDMSIARHIPLGGMGLMMHEKCWNELNDLRHAKPMQKAIESTDEVTERYEQHKALQAQRTVKALFKPNDGYVHKGWIDLDTVPVTGSTFAEVKGQMEAYFRSKYGCQVTVYNWHSLNHAEGVDVWIEDEECRKRVVN
jgi:hypothetical protein